MILGTIQCRYSTLMSVGERRADDAAPRRLKDPPLSNTPVATEVAVSDACCAAAALLDFPIGFLRTFSSSLLSLESHRLFFFPLVSLASRDPTGGARLCTTRSNRAARLVYAFETWRTTASGKPFACTTAPETHHSQQGYAVNCTLYSTFPPWFGCDSEGN